MNSNIIRRKKARERAVIFYEGNIADLGTNTTLTAQFAIIESELTIIETAMTDQVGASGDVSQAYDHKDIEREDLREQMQPIAFTARRMDVIIPGIGDKYKMPSKRSDQEMIATAKAWALDLPKTEVDFVNFGMPATFIDDLSAAATAFESTISPTSNAIDDRVEATADIGESDRKGMAALRICDTVIRNIYANDPGKLAAWLSASHVEKG